ncbi:hypothetical protein DPMN_147300 [Dreissena polymorpha]|uniref:Paraneoplastic antigen Ma-like C-terminal domain-containing protein n=1 Tax=Dreissena polymorpha TaxID=45954 RepID=A0A9D4F7I3_DREPO|nr:hypothetical protein DPMN_147300 [Dreissena polymorpha]
MMKSGIYHQYVLRQSIRNSITGKPRKVLSTLKPDASLQEILKTLETNFGDIKTGQSVMEIFYNAKQEKDEDISTWAIRLETLIQKAINHNEMQEDKKDAMLRTRFWRHFRNTDLRNATRVYYETVSTFEEFKVKVRRKEREMAVCKGTELP